MPRAGRFWIGPCLLVLKRDIKKGDGHAEAFLVAKTSLA